MKIIDTASLQHGEKLSRNTQDWVYNGLDCCVTLEICNELLSQLDNTSKNTYEFSKSLQGPILEMSIRGIKVDKRKKNEVLANYKKQIEFISDQLNEIIRDGIGLNINWRSTTQLKKLFYEVLKLPVQKKRNANGIFGPTVNRDAMEKLEQYMLAEPICIRLLTLRDIDKKRMFLETEIDPDGRMRCNFNIAGTNTGRLSSSMSDFGTGTNLQNVDREERAIFIADEGMKFGNLDLEQADARNVGAICWNNFITTFGERFAGVYLSACESGDLHTTTCKLAWPNLAWAGDAKADKIVAEAIAYRQDSYRQLAKKLGHGTNYYGTPRTMAKHSKVPTKQIEEFQKAYFKGFPCIPEWHKWVKGELKETGQLTTLFGRRRTFFGRSYEDTTLREAIAYSPQSMTADEIDTGLLKLFRAERVQLLVQVHDSILIQYPEEQEDEIIPWAMEQLKIHLELAKGRPFVVPVDCKVGWNWGEVLYDKKTGKEIGNLDGLVKWKGHDPRTRSENKRLSLRSLL